MPGTPVRRLIFAVIPNEVRVDRFRARVYKAHVGPDPHYLCLSRRRPPKEGNPALTIAPGILRSDDRYVISVTSGRPLAGSYRTGESDGRVCLPSWAYSRQPPSRLQLGSRDTQTNSSHVQHTQKRSIRGDRP